MEELRHSPLVGAIWETYVFSELRKREAGRRLHWSVYFWHDRSREVDFVTDRGGRFEIWEAKWTENPSVREASAVEYLRRLLGERFVLKQSVVCRASHRYPLTDSTDAVNLDDL